MGKELQAYVESYPQKCPMANRRGWVSRGRKEDILGGRRNLALDYHHPTGMRVRGDHTSGFSGEKSVFSSKIS